MASAKVTDICARFHNTAQLPAKVPLFKTMLHKLYFI